MVAAVLILAPFGTTGKLASIGVFAALVGLDAAHAPAAASSKPARGRASRHGQGRASPVRGPRQFVDAACGPPHPAGHEPSVSIHHHPFFFVPAYDRAMTKLVFVSYRTGAPQIFFEDRASGDLVQATDRADLADWSISPSPTAATSISPPARRPGGSISTRFAEEQLADFGAVEMREKGMVGAAMGTTALSRQRPLVGGAGQGRAGDALRADRHRAEDLVRVPRARHHRPSAVLPGRRRSHPLCRAAHRPGLGHRPQRPQQPAALRARGPHAVGHPRGVGAGTPRGRVRGLAARHAADRRRQRRRALDHALSRPGTRRPTTTGRRFVCDTKFPDRGLHIYDVDDDGRRGRAAVPERSQQPGRPLGRPVPLQRRAGRGRSRQHTHPHPRFSPDGSRVLFTSDRSGHAQLYEVMLEDRQ